MTGSLINFLYSQKEKCMTIFKKNNDKDTIALWKKECEKCRKERDEAVAEIDQIRRYKNDYEEMMKELRALKEKYLEKIETLNVITDSYEKELEKIVSQK